MSIFVNALLWLVRIVTVANVLYFSFRLDLLTVLFKSPMSLLILSALSIYNFVTKRRSRFCFSYLKALLLDIHV